MAEAKTVIFEKDRETKNMVRFNEVEAEGQTPFVRTAYVPKYWVGTNKKIKITYETIEED